MIGRCGVEVDRCVVIDRGAGVSWGGGRGRRQELLEV